MHSRSLGREETGQRGEGQELGHHRGVVSTPQQPPMLRAVDTGCDQPRTPASSFFYSRSWMAEVAPAAKAPLGAEGLGAGGQGGWELGGRRSGWAGGGPGGRFLALDQEPRVE